MLSRSAEFWRSSQGGRCKFVWELGNLLPLHIPPYTQAASSPRGCWPQITAVVSSSRSGSSRSQWLGQLHFLFSFPRGISLEGPLKEQWLHLHLWVMGLAWPMAEPQAVVGIGRLWELVVRIAPGCPAPPCCLAPDTGGRKEDGCRDQKMELVPSQCAEGWPPRLVQTPPGIKDLCAQGSLAQGSLCQKLFSRVMIMRWRVCVCVLGGGVCL